MSEVDDLKKEVAELRLAIINVKEQLQQLQRLFPGILGPQPESSEEFEQRNKRMVQILTDAVKKDAPPVDRTALCTTNGKSPEEVRANQKNETGQHDGYIVLCAEERAKGFVRPYRTNYKHVGREEERRDDVGGPVHIVRVGGCGVITVMGHALSETYARDPSFYGATFCCGCNKHLPVNEFIWVSDGQVVGS